MAIDFEAIRRRFSLREQIARYGSKVGRDGRFKCVLPGHKDKTPSASVSKVKGFEHWRCHACDRGGDICDLVAAVEGCTLAEAAARLTGEERPQRAPERLPEDDDRLGLVFDLIPIPEGVEAIRAGAETPPILSKRGKVSTVVPADTYLYRSPDGAKVGYVLRIEAADGSKRTLPVRYERTRGFVWAGWTGTDAPPLLNAPALARRRDTTVLVVEGEKCARVGDAVLREDFVVTCWQGGTAGVKKADFSLLRDRDVIFWPDADEPGKKAMRAAAAKAGAARSWWVEPSPDWPEGHDIADLLNPHDPHHLGLDGVRSWLAGKELITAAPEPAELPPPGGWVRAGQGGWVPDDAFVDLTKESTLALRSEINGWTGISHHPFFTELRWDVVRRQVMLGAREINPGADYNFLQAELARHTQVRLPIAQLAKHVVNKAMLTPINPLADRLKVLTWDGKSRPLARYAGAKENAWTLAAFERWFLGLVGRILEPGIKHDIMIVLEGEQGLGKSTFFEVLAQPFGYDGFVELHRLTGLDDASMMKVDGKLIVEMSEMGAYRRADRDAFKAILSSRVDRYRRPYAEEYVQVPRTCVFCGTTNPTGQYLTDTSGNRRIAPIKVVLEPQLDRLRSDLDQVYAEAVVRYTALKAAGAEVNWFTRDEIALQKLATGKREVVSIFAERLETNLRTFVGETIEQQEVWRWAELMTPRDRHAFRQELSDEMRRHGFELRRGSSREDRRTGTLWRRLKPP